MILMYAVNLFFCHRNKFNFENASTSFLHVSNCCVALIEHWTGISTENAHVFYAPVIGFGESYREFHFKFILMKLVLFVRTPLCSLAALYNATNNDTCHVFPCPIAESQRIWYMDVSESLSYLIWFSVCWLVLSGWLKEFPALFEMNPSILSTCLCIVRPRQFSHRHENAEAATFVLYAHGLSIFTAIVSFYKRPLRFTA